MPTVTVIQPIIAAEQNTKIRCAAYCRVSSDSEDQLNSFMAQTRYYSQVFKDSETEELIDIYADEGITGTREDKRDEFQRMLKDCRRGKIDRIYTKSISRFARNTKDCLKSVRELKALGITIFFEKENIDTANMTDEMMITIMGGLAQEESTSISQNMRWSIKKRMENGTFELSCPPYGYIKENGKLVVDPAQAQTVQNIFSWYLSGYGIISIVNRLNHFNTPCCKRSNKWHMFGVTYILTNEKYTGNTMFQKTYSGTTLPIQRYKNNGERNKYYAVNTHPAIVSQDDFDKVQALMSEKGEIFYKTEKQKCVLRKIMKCGQCGSTYIRKKSRDKYYWSCRKHDLKASECFSKRIPESDIYYAFIRICNTLISHYTQLLIPLQTALQYLKLKKFSGQTQVMDIHKEVAKLKEQTHVLARLKTKGFLDEAKYIEQTTELTAKINKLQAELKKLQKRLGITFIYITHDQEEAINMSDRIVVMNQGVFEQIGCPDEVYNHPKTSFVATFVGNANIIKGVVERVVQDKALVVACKGKALVDLNGETLRPGEQVTLAVRSENISLDEDCGCGLEATVEEKTFSGGLLRMVLRAEDGSTLVSSRYGIDANVQVGQKVCFRWESNQAVLVDRG